MKAAITFDSRQQEAMERLEAIEKHLEKAQNSGAKKWFRAFAGAGNQRSAIGLYMWGGVGRGKTMIMDRFYNQLSEQRKLRLHFHRFMQLVHKQRAELRNVEDPIGKVAEQFADQAKLLCLDEMHITDITDAMIMGRLLEKLFERNVVLITTSNVPPDDLYKTGLQRDRFKPAIALLNQRLEVFNLDAGVDYRLQQLVKTAIYQYPLNQDAANKLRAAFDRATELEQVEYAPVRINSRDIDVVCKSHDVVWFKFEDLCETNRAVNDYIEIGRFFHTVIIEGIPQLDETSNDPARRFISMIDEFYDRRVKVIVSAAVSVSELYDGKKLAFEFERTQSRLHEMQSEEYLSAAHIP